MDSTLPDQQPIEQTQSEEKKNKIKALALLEVGLFEFLFVGIVLVLFFGTLNYFNILQVSSVFPNQLGFLPHKPYQPSQQLNNVAMKQINNITTIPSPTQPFLLNSLIAKAKSLGYSIILISPDDTVGRTAFYNSRMIINNEGMGIKKTKNAKGKESAAQIVGAFEELKDIKNSSDKYMLITNPDTKEKFPLIRIIIDISSPSSPQDNIPTQLLVEDLNYNGETASLSAQSLGSISQLSIKEIGEIFHKGDSIAVGLKINPQGNTIDENNNLQSLVLYVRRFGGKTEIEKEISRKL